MAACSPEDSHAAVGCNASKCCQFMQLASKALELGMAGVACLHLWRQQLLNFQAWRAICPVPSTGQATDQEGGTR